MILEFDNLFEFYNAANVIRDQYPDGSWSGDDNEPPELALDRILHGNDALAAEAEKIMDKLSAQIETTQREWTPQPFGPVHIIPEVLSGFPLCSRRMIPNETDCAPIRIFVGIVYSGGFDHETVIQRGVAILALVMAMQAKRPTEIVLFTEMHGRDDGKTLFKIRVDSQPLSLAHACHVLTSVRFVRSICYEMGRHVNGFNGMWCDGHANAGDSLRDPNNPYILKLKQWLGAGEQDLVIPGAFISDPIVSDPVEYVNRTIATLSGNEDYVPKEDKPLPPTKRSGFKRRGSRGW